MERNNVYNNHDHKELCSSTCCCVKNVFLQEKYKSFQPIVPVFKAETRHLIEMNVNQRWRIRSAWSRLNIPVVLRRNTAISNSRMSGCGIKHFSYEIQYIIFIMVQAKLLYLYIWLLLVPFVNAEIQRHVRQCVRMFHRLSKGIWLTIATQTDWDSRIYWDWYRRSMRHHSKQQQSEQTGLHRTTTIGRGVRQQCLLSLPIFNLYSQAVFREAGNVNGNTINNLRLINWWHRGIASSLQSYSCSLWNTGNA